MKKITTAAITTALVAGLLPVGSSVAAAAPMQPQLDTGAQICATAATARGKADCFAKIATNRRPTAAEVRCVKGFGISVAGVVAGQRLNREPARALMYRVVVAGVLGCVGGLIA
jgi:hypothetical protein